MNESENGKIPEVQWWKIALPALFGLATSAYLIATTFNISALHKIKFSSQLFAGLLLGVVAVLVRDFAFMYKIRLSTGEKLTWGSVLQVIILWEFGSAVTPGAVGGIAFAFFLLKKEGLSYGRSMAAVMLNTFLDNVAFVTVFSVLFLLIGKKMFLVPADCTDLQGNIILQGLSNLASKAWVGYLGFVAAALFFAVSLFVLPHTTKKFFHKLSGFRLLKSFRNGLIHLGDEIEITSAEYKKQNFSFWSRMVAATFINWMSRYALANALLFAFSNTSLNMLEVYARQYVLWIFLVVPSTPGASGLAEFSFMAMNCQFIPAGLSATVTMLWRMYSYYIYLVLGSVVLSHWLKNMKTRY